MMKTEKLLAVVMTLWMLGVISMIAQPRSIQELDAIANSVLANNGARSVNRMVMSMTSSQVLKSIPMGQDETFYVYTPAVGKKEGFVIVSGDKRMPAVLGYSDKNAFDATHIPDGLRWFLEKCHVDISLVNSGAAIVASSENQSKSVSIAPLLGNRVWDQGKPFNNYCPEVSAGIRTVTGCTATAMAQIMAYHRHPAKGTGNISYTTPTFGYSVQADMDNASAYDWGNMIDSYDGAYSTTQAKAVAQLMFHAGAAIATDFCEISSGANTNSPEGAFVTHFGYDDEIRIVRRTDCADDTWSTLLQQEIAAGRPVLVSGFDNSGYGGHAFVFDGLDTEGNFHINWGWSGLCDGYYNLYNLIPEETGVGGGFGEYNYNCQAVVGIHPEDGVKETDPTNIVVEYTTSANGLGTFDLNTSISLNLQNFINMRHLSFKGDAQLMLTDATGDKTIAMLGSPLFINTPSGLPQGSYIGNISLTASLPADITDGNYRLYIGVRQSGYEQWGRVKTIISDISNRYGYYGLTVADGEYTLKSADNDDNNDEGGDDNYEGVPTSIDQISNGKAYTVRCARGILGIQNNRLVATSREDITLEAQKFVFYKYNSKFYLYNLENRMFIALDDNTSEGDRYAQLSDTPAKVTLGHTGNADYPFIIKFGDLWLNVYKAYEPGLVINSWDIVDDGNQFRLEPVENVSETVQAEIKSVVEEYQALEPKVILPWGSDTPWNCTYRFSESYDNYTEPANDVAGHNWKELNYDDSSWPTMTGPIASSSNTPLPSYNHTWDGDYNSYDLRRKFTMENTIPELSKVYFRTLFDDEIRVFLNGNLLIEDTQYTGSTVRQYEIPADAFVVGENILSIRIVEVVAESYFDYSIEYEQLPNPYTDAQGVKYQLSAEDNTAIIIGHVASMSKDLTIPLSVKDYAVKGIASGAFADVTDLASVTMLLAKPYALPTDAFSSAVYQHAQLIVPYGHESVYQNTAGWSQFNNVTYYAPDEYTDEQGVVYALNEDGETYMVKGYTENLVSKVVIPERLHGKAVTVIGDYAFENAISLKEISLSEGLLHIGDFSFIKTNLTEMTVPNSVTTIENAAFSEIATLKKVHIGKGVSMIVSNASFGVGYNPFQHCPLLEAITVDEENRLFSSFKGVLYDKAQSVLCALPGSITAMKANDFSASLTKVAPYALCGAKVEELVFPASVSIFDDACFQSCDQLKSLTIPSHATNFCNTILRYCSALEHLYVHGYYPDRSFANGELLEYTKGNCTVHVPKGMKQTYLDKMAECGRMRTVVDDIEPATAIDVDYSLGYQCMNMLIGCPKLGAGFLLTKDQIQAYKGCRIVSVQLQIANFEENSLTVAVTKGVGGATLRQTTVDIGAFNAWRKIAFDEPYVITGEEEELFIGVTTSGGLLISYTETSAPENTLWFDWGGLEGTDWQPWNSTEGLAIAYTIEGDNLPANIRMTETTLTADEQGNHRIKGKLESYTIGLVDGCDIAYSINGGEPMTTHLDLQMVAKRHYEFEIPVTAEVGAGKHQVDVWVSKVGDRPDGIDSDSHAQFTLVGQSERYERKVVVEEGTGTWCGYCPRGIVGMRTMLENYPDNFIPIAVHSGDNMDSPTYGELAWRFAGLPACTMNRKFDFDPNAADLEKYFQQEVNQAVARIGMEAMWADEAQTKVQIKTTSRFAFDMTEEYRIAYAVTESGVGPYPQANYYSGGEEMGGFEKEAGAVSILHDHVARSISNLNGEPGSVPNQPLGMTDYEYSYTLTLPDNIDNKENIQLVVLLINQETGEIMNADNVSFSGISAYDPTVSIDKITIDNQTDNRYYDLQGRQLNGHPTVKGIYIHNGKKMVIR